MIFDSGILYMNALNLTIHAGAIDQWRRRSRKLLLVALLVASPSPAGLAAPPPPLSGTPNSIASLPDRAVSATTNSRLVFGRDVRPILSDKCFACHGRDRENAESDLRLDLPEAALQQDEEGRAAIVPGNLLRSEVARRIDASDPEERMPPLAAHKELSGEEKQILRQWIVEGAAYEEHWSLVAPQRPAAPTVRKTTWPQNEIDRYVLAQLEARGLNPSVEADRRTLARRVSLDLRGLPPSRNELADFLADASPSAYEKYVDRMLASPHFGEKMTRIWMDLGRYGDTNGYHYDSTRQVWKWRDWVLAAYNSNMPFDQFTMEQLAGDLFPDATLKQQIASGFNRNSRFNEEGGADPEEFRVRYAVDRTNTLGQVWLGLTLGCAECHSHKYDPISQREFYELYAFFNSFDEPGSQGHNQRYEPVIQTPNKQQLEEKRVKEAPVAEIEQQIADAVKQFADQMARSEKAAEPQRAQTEFFWIDDDVPPGVQMTGNQYTWEEEPLPVLMGRRAVKRANFGQHGRHAFLTQQYPLALGAGDLVFYWLFLKTENVPPIVTLRFNTTGTSDGWKHGFYWGGDKLPPADEAATVWQRRGDLPEKGTWVRLEIPVADLGLATGGHLYGIESGQFRW